MVILPRLPEWWLINIACLRTGNRIETTQLSLWENTYFFVPNLSFLAA